MKFILFNKDSWQEIFGSIKKSKLRTAITIIGVLWGIFLFITLLGTARGMENGFDREFKNMATNSIFLWGERTTIPYKGFQRGKRMRLKMQDVDALKRQIPAIEFVAPRTVKGVFGGSSANIKRNNVLKTYKLFGDYPIIDKVSKFKLLEGRFINLTDINEERKVCVIGEKVIDELYEKDDKIINSYIEIDGVFFQVVGLYKEKTNGFEQDDSVVVPFSTYRKLYNLGDNIGWMVIAANENADIQEVEEDVKNLLRKRHTVHPDDKRAFGSFNFGEMFGKITGFIKGMKFLTWFVGIATLLAGVIAISSILLITVKERTKEIGIRRAIGAKPKDIRNQIVLESVFLTTIAGALGIIFSGFILMLIDFLVSDKGGMPFTNPTVDIPIAIGSVVALVTFGSLVGLIPAQKAVSVRPIEALSDE